MCEERPIWDAFWAILAGKALALLLSLGVVLGVVAATVAALVAAGM